MKFMDLNIGYEKRKQDIDAKIASVIGRSQFIFGPELEELEKTLAEYVGVKYALGVASGTDALVLALMALGIMPGENNSEKEVIVPSYTFIATAESAAFLGAKVVFCDVDEDTQNMNTEMLKTLITDKTKAIIPVNLFGQCADFDAINAIAKEKNIPVIEDACQSFGASHKGKKSCSLTEIGVTSFFPAKPLGCFGDGGMLFTDNEEIYTKVKMLRHHGDAGGMNHKYIGMTGRLDNLQAAILLGKFVGFDDDVKARKEAAEYYSENLKDVIKTPKIEDGNISVYAQYCVRSEKRDAIMAHLKEKEIPTPIYYRKPLHTAECFSELGYKEQDMPVSVKLSGEIFALPIYPEISREDQDIVISEIKNALS